MADYIERQAAKELLKRVLLETAFNNTGIPVDAGDAYEDAAKRLEISWMDLIPPADVRPANRGKWIHKTTEIRSTGDGFYEGGYWWYECSYCGVKPPHLWVGTEWLSAYCPSCGAQMGGDADGSAED